MARLGARCTRRCAGGLAFASSSIGRRAEHRHCARLDDDAPYREVELGRLLDGKLNGLRDRQGARPHNLAVTTPVRR